MVSFTSNISHPSEDMKKKERTSRLYVFFYSEAVFSGHPLHPPTKVFDIVSGLELSPEKRRRVSAKCSVKIVGEVPAVVSGQGKLPTCLLSKKRGAQYFSQGRRYSSPATHGSVLDLGWRDAGSSDPSRAALEQAEVVVSYP